MTIISDYSQHGYFPLQDHSWMQSGFPLGAKLGLAAVRITKHEPTEEATDPETQVGLEDGKAAVGDMHPWLFWQTKDRGDRAMGSWTQAMASVVTHSDPYYSRLDCRPLLTDEYDLDERYQELRVESPLGLQVPPKGSLVLTMSPTTEEEQQPITINVDPRLIATTLGPGQFGTLVADVDQGGEICMEESDVPGKGGRHARLHSLLRVVAVKEGVPFGELGQGSDLNTIALNWTNSKADNIPNQGAVFMSLGQPVYAPTGGNPITGAGSSTLIGGSGTQQPSTESLGNMGTVHEDFTNNVVRSGNRFGHTENGSGQGFGTGGIDWGTDNGEAGKTLREFGQFIGSNIGEAIALMAHTDKGFGPITAGAHNDKHFHSRDRDGHPIHSAHISTRAFYFQDNQKDGPLDFSPIDYPDNPQSHPIATEVWCSYHEDKLHAFRDGVLPGMWRWWTTTPIVEPTTGDPDPQTPFKPTTGGGGGGGGGRRNPPPPTGGGGGGGGRKKPKGPTTGGPANPGSTTPPATGKPTTGGPAPGEEGKPVPSGPALDLRDLNRRRHRKHPGFVPPGFGNTKRMPSTGGTDPGSLQPTPGEGGSAGGDGGGGRGGSPSGLCRVGYGTNPITGGPSGSPVSGPLTGAPGPSANPPTTQRPRGPLTGQRPGYYSPAPPGGRGGGIPASTAMTAVMQGSTPPYQPMLPSTLQAIAIQDPPSVGARGGPGQGGTYASLPQLEIDRSDQLRDPHTREPSTKPGVTPNVGSPKVPAVYQLFMPMHTGFGAISFRPQLMIEGAPNFEHNPLLPSRSYQDDERTRPAVLSMRAFGHTRVAQADFGYVERPGEARPRGGTSDGGVLLSPPRFELEDYFDIKSAEDVTDTTSAKATTSHMLHAPGVKSSFGLPTITGGLQTGGAQLGQISTQKPFGVSIQTAAGSTTDAITVNYDTGSSDIQVEMEGSGSLKLPSGTTAERPTNLLSEGSIRWNSTNSSTEVYNGSTWEDVGGGDITQSALTMTTQRLLGNSDAAGGTGDIQEIVLASDNLTLSDGVLQVVSIGPDVIDDAAVTTEKIEDDAVTLDKVAFDIHESVLLTHVTNTGSTTSVTLQQGGQALGENNVGIPVDRSCVSNSAVVTWRAGTAPAGTWTLTLKKKAAGSRSYTTAATMTVQVNNG